MSLDIIPEIPGVDPAAVKALTRLCSGESSDAPIVQAPRLVDLGDDIFVMFTDGMTAVLLKMEGDELPELEGGEVHQEKFASMIAAYGGDYTLAYEGVDVRSILDWCMEGTEVCPRCHGKRPCMFPRNGNDRENPDILEAHVGWLGTALMDRRRIQIPLQMLGVDEGDVDVVVVEKPEGDLTSFSGVAIIGDNWRIYSAGVTQSAETVDRDGKALRFPL